jgi:hypothetical protein
VKVKAGVLILRDGESHGHPDNGLVPIIDHRFAHEGTIAAIEEDVPRP